MQLSAFQRRRRRRLSGRRWSRVSARRWSAPAIRISSCAVLLCFTARSEDCKSGETPADAGSTGLWMGRHRQVCPVSRLTCAGAAHRVTETVVHLCRQSRRYDIGRRAARIPSSASEDCLVRWTLRALPSQVSVQRSTATSAAGAEFRFPHGSPLHSKTDPAPPRRAGREKTVNDIVPEQVP